MPSFKFEGASGQGHVYALLPWDAPAVPQRGGILILAEATHMQPRPLLILDARRLREMFVRMGADAAINHGAYLLYFRDEPDNDARAAEAKDLIAAYRPTMNAKFAASQSRHRDSVAGD